MCCGVARGLNLPHPEIASFKECLLRLRKYTFSKKDHVAILKQFQNPPSGCRKCLWANSGDLFPQSAGDGRIFFVFMSGAHLSFWALPAGRKRIIVACRSNLTFVISDSSESRIVPLYEENNTFFKFWTLFCDFCVAGEAIGTPPRSLLMGLLSASSLQKVTLKLNTFALFCFLLPF